MKCIPKVMIEIAKTIKEFFQRVKDKNIIMILNIV